MTDHNAWFQELRAERARAAALELEQAKAAAHAAGKEPLDVARVERLWRHHPDARLEAAGVHTSRDERVRDWEHQYYLLYPELRTVEAFVEKMRALDLAGALD